MENVGVRELKARLSMYLRRVARGERLLVTERGRPVAALSPVESGPSLEWAHAMVSAGHAGWSGGKPSGLPSRIKLRGTPTSQMVLEDRR